VGVARHWIARADVDGFRLDVANEVARVLWRELMEAAKASKPDVFVVGEVWHRASSWLRDGCFHSVMNYPWRSAVRDVLARAARALLRTRQQDGRTLIKLLGDAIGKSMQSLMIIGGFIISFSVAIEMLNASGLLGYLESALALSSQAVLLAVNGLLEITIGCQQAAHSALPMSGKIIAMSAIIAWSGLSVHGQVAAFISKTDMSIRPYVFARIVHAALAALYTALLFKLGWVPSLPAWVVQYSGAGLATRYWLAAQNMCSALLIWAGAGLLLLIFSFCANCKLAAFRVHQRRN